jgi:hypothetical protein
MSGGNFVSWKINLMNPLTPLAIFLGSALLFCLQPMVGRTLLPAFGGAAAVWSVCLATFQALLVGGYAYAHGLNMLDARRQRRTHVALLGVAVAWTLAVAVAGLAWARTHLHAGAHPAPEVLLVVLVGVGVPYLVLSSGSSLLQAWAGAGTGVNAGVGASAGAGSGRGVYRLYAVSNLGSFLGLFAYPFLMEPFVPLRWQWLGWCAGLAVYLALVACVAWVPQKARSAPVARDALEAALAVSESPEKTGPVALPRGLSGAAWWFVLPGLSSFTLVATTNHLSMDVAPMPLLWAILLGAFLLSYVAGFSRAGERWIPVWRVLAPAALIGCGFAAQNQGGDAFVASIAAGTAMVFFCGTFLHGWLYATRPEGARLTRFYLGVAVGGAAGGMLVSFVAPLLFSGYWEYQIALVGCAVVALVFTVLSWERVWYVRIFSGVLALASVCACMLVWTATGMDNRGIVLRARNFHGALKVGEGDLYVGGVLTRVYMLTNGGTLHGEQAHDDDDETVGKMATTYYGPLAGGLSVMLHEKWAGRAGGANGASGKINLRDIEKLAEAREARGGEGENGGEGGGDGEDKDVGKGKDGGDGKDGGEGGNSGNGGRPMRVGAIGLGTGTMARWARVGDTWRFFEINPLVDRVAHNGKFFTYLAKSDGAPRTVVGDARLMLEREQAAGEAAYDVLIVDAYSGDSVPLHLATEEAFQLYAKRLAPGGILAVHISNWHMDLLPLCKAAARALGMQALGVQSSEDSDRLIEGALWVFLSREPVNVDATGSEADIVDFSRVRDIRLPTDEWGSLQGLIRFNYDVPVMGRDGGEDE